MGSIVRDLSLTSARGPFRHFTASQQFGRFRMQTGHGPTLTPNASVESDPKRTSLKRYMLVVRAIKRAAGDCNVGN